MRTNRKWNFPAFLAVIGLLVLCALSGGCVSFRRPVVVTPSETKVYTGLGSNLGVAATKQDLWMDGYLRNVSQCYTETIYFPDGFFLLENDDWFKSFDADNPEQWQALTKKDFVILEPGEYSKRLRAVGGLHYLQVSYVPSGNCRGLFATPYAVGPRPFIVNLNFTKRDAPLRVSNQVLYYDWLKDVDFWGL